MIIKNALMLNENFEFVNSDIYIKDGVIKKISPEIAEEDEVFDAEGNYAVPGFINLHVHGFSHDDVMDGQAEGIERMSSFFLAGGVTGFLATTATATYKDTMKALSAVKKAKKSGKCRNLYGVHLEGPFLNKDFKGAHKKQWLCEPDKEYIDGIFGNYSDLVKIISIAPECKKAAKFIKNYSDKVIFSLGHGGDDYKLCVKCFENGATRVTHLFNAMPQLHHRNKSLIHAAYENNATVELICDGMHLDKTTVLMAIKLFGRDNVNIITDGICGTGLPDGKYKFCGSAMILKDGVARNKDGALVGSTATMLDCVKNLVSWGEELSDVIKMASYNPAKALKIDDKTGLIKENYDSDIVILDKNLDIVRVFTK